MTLVEGVGDEVTQFFIALLLVLLALAAWWSTQIADTPLVRTVLILERRTRQRLAPGPPPRLRLTARPASDQQPVVAEIPNEPTDTGQQQQVSNINYVHICYLYSTGYPARFLSYYVS
jgi:hypothetical protein